MAYRKRLKRSRVTADHNAMTDIIARRGEDAPIEKNETHPITGNPIDQK